MIIKNRNEEYRVVGNVLYSSNEPMALIRPGVALSRQEGYLTLQGANGRVKIADGPEALFAALVATNSLLLGEKANVIFAANLLRDEATSRNAAYFCAYADSCDTVVSAYEAIRNSCLIIIGCGGIGSLSAIMLAGLGVKSIYLVDPDQVELSNLNRQFAYCRSDVGRNKAVVLREYLEARFDALVEAIPSSAAELRALEFSRGNSFAIITADTPRGVCGEIVSSLMPRGIKCMHAGYLFNFDIVRDSNMLAAVSAESIDWENLDGSVMPSASINNVRISAEVVARIASEMTGLQLKGELLAECI